ncbi:hypothetical protein HK097_009694 [Rhizophlyctis rosea]|uniref:RNase H type-1 domain-containing protein n=1 Tax=Rhizophlyctis rosea TaxID=64517 RepID=A0AAD5SA71_9FUNG|nr:hypothetical protein HK097_009694 [Rhizophlyctis rosea]
MTSKLSFHDSLFSPIDTPETTEPAPETTVNKTEGDNKELPISLGMALEAISDDDEAALTSAREMTDGESNRKKKGKHADEGDFCEGFARLSVPAKVAASALCRHVTAALGGTENVFVNGVHPLGEHDEVMPVLVEISGPRSELKRLVESYEGGVFFGPGSPSFASAKGFIMLRKGLAELGENEHAETLNIDVTSVLSGSSFAGDGFEFRGGRSDFDDEGLRFGGESLGFNTGGSRLKRSREEVERNDSDEEEPESDEDDAFESDDYDVTHNNPSTNSTPPNPNFFRTIRIDGSEQITEAVLINDRRPVGFGDVREEQVYYTDGSQCEECMKDAGGKVRLVKMATHSKVNPFNASENTAIVCKQTNTSSGCAELEGVVLLLESAPDGIILRVFVDWVGMIVKCAKAVQHGVPAGRGAFGINLLLDRFKQALARKRDFALYMAWVKAHGTSDTASAGNRTADKLAKRLCIAELANTVAQKEQSGWTKHTPKKKKKQRDKEQRKATESASKKQKTGATSATIRNGATGTDTGSGSASGSGSLGGSGASLRGGVGYLARSGASRGGGGSESLSGLEGTFMQEY